LHAWGLIAGWVVGMGWGIYLLYGIPNGSTGKGHFGGSALMLGKLSIGGWHPFAGSATQIYVGAIALLANLVVAVVVTAIVRAVRVPAAADETASGDYVTDEAAPKLAATGTR
jgi:SSS family solute:Na+ symporter